MRKSVLALSMLGLFGLLAAQTEVFETQKAISENPNSITTEVMGIKSTQATPMAERVYSLVGTAFFKGDGYNVANWDYDIDFIYQGKTGNDYTYTIKRQELFKNGEFKVRLNHNWVDPSWGYNELTIISPDLFGWVGYNIKALDRKVYDINFIVDSLNNTYKLSLQYSIPLKSRVIITKTATAPTIGGVVDAIWATANTYNIDQAVVGTTPSLGNSGTTTWKGLWDDNGIYILLNINDNVFFPAYNGVNSGNVWEYDKPEIYFDVNSVLIDGAGTNVPNNGHIQIAPDIIESQISGIMAIDGWGVKNSFLVANQTYTAEYFIPFSRLLDKTGIQVTKTAEMGFDVTVIDRDSEVGYRQRAVWTNFGLQSESWNTMDDCGTIILVGSGANVLVSGITITTPGNVSTITTEAGTLLMGSSVLPVDATNKNLTWSVTNGTGKASISASGLLTAIENGTVTVIATTKDASGISASKSITISNQYISFADGSLIKNGGFETNGPIASPWIFTTGNGGSASVVNGVCTLTTAAVADVYYLQVSQNGWVAYNDSSYNLSFTAWSDVSRTFSINIADYNNNYIRAGISTDANALFGRSEWVVPVTTTPTVYTYHITVDQIKVNSDLYLNVMTSNALGTIYIDDISLLNVGYKPLGNGPPLGGTISAVSAICSGTSTTLVLSEYSGAIQWQKSANGTTGWTNVTDGSGALTASYTTGNLPSTTYFRASVSKPDYSEVYSNTLMVTVNPLPSATGIITGSKFICSGQNKVVGYLVPDISNASSYVWTMPTGVTGSSTTKSINVKYGATAVSGNISVRGRNACGDGVASTIPVTVSTPFQSEQICLVTIDLETGKNMVVWEKTKNVGITSYNVYREGTVVNKYDLIGNVPATDMSLFVDLASKPEQQQYTYKISVIDTCGNESAMSPWHQTMFLQYVSSAGGVNLNWAKYKTETGDLNFDSYTIFRGSDSTKLTELGTIASSSQVYTDKTTLALSEKMFYRVGGVKANPCDPVGIGGKKASSGPYVHSLSNLEDNRLQSSTGVDINQTDFLNLKVYPSPFSDITTIGYSLKNASDITIEIFNIVGEKTRVLLNEHQMAGSHKAELKASDVNFQNGLYYIRIIADGHSVVRKIMLNK